MTPNDIAMEQINLGFNEQEDRLLLKIGLSDQSEVAVWITRRVCKTMWSLLQSTNSNLNAKTAPTPLPSTKEEAMQNFARDLAEQKSIEQLDFNSSYIADRHRQTKLPLLAKQCTITETENKLPSLEIQCTNGKNVNIGLPPDLVYALANMMQLATRDAGWDLLITPDNTKISLTHVHQLLH